MLNFLFFVFHEVFKLTLVSYKWVLEILVDCQLESIVEDSRQQLLEQGGAFIQARIGIYLNEPDCHVVVNHEIVSKHFEAAKAFVRIYFAFDRIDSLGDNVLDVLNQVLLDADGRLTLLDESLVVVLVDVLLELFETKLVSVFKPAVVLGVPLDRIVRQVNGVVLAVVQDVLEGRRAQVALSAEVDLHILADEHPHSNVELAVLDEVGSFDVLLNDEAHVFGDLDGRAEMLQVCLQLVFIRDWGEQGLPLLLLSLTLVVVANV